MANSILGSPVAFCCSFSRNLGEEDFEESKAMEGAEAEMARLSIDFKAAQLFFDLVKQTRGVLGCQNFITDLVGKLSEAIKED